MFILFPSSRTEVRRRLRLPQRRVSARRPGRRSRLPGGRDEIPRGARYQGETRDHKEALRRQRGRLRRYLLRRRDRARTRPRDGPRQCETRVRRAYMRAHRNWIC